MLSKNIKLPIEELYYVKSDISNIITKIIRRRRIKKIFKRFHKKSLYYYLINSYNSCFESTLEDHELFRLISSGILICVGSSEDQSLDTCRRIRMNPYLFNLIIF